MRIIKTKIYPFEELSEEVQEKILNKHRYFNTEFDGWYDDNQMLEPTTEQLKERRLKIPESLSPLFSWKKIYFSLDRARYIQFQDLYVSDYEIFRKFLQIPKKLWESCTYDFCEVSRYSTTKIEITKNDYSDFTPKQQEIIDNAETTMNEHIKEVLNWLDKEYDYQTSDEQVKESLIANEYEFTESGEKV